MPWLIPVNSNREMVHDSDRSATASSQYHFVCDNMPPADRIAAANAEIVRRFGNAFEKRMLMLRAGRDVFEACDGKGAKKLVYA